MDDSSHQDGQRKDQPDDKPNSGTPQNRENIIPAGDSDNWPRILETLGVFIFGGFGVGLTESGFHFWAFLCDFLAVGCGIGLVCHHIKQSRLIKRVWMLFWPLLFLDFLVFAFLLWHIETETEKSKAHFTLSLGIGDLPDFNLILTNDMLFRFHSEIVTNLNDKSFIFTDYPKGCLVIPVQEGKSNVVFKFIAKNDSSVKVTDLELIVGFPKKWNCVADFSKWREVEQHLIIPGEGRLDIKSLKCWCARSAYPLFPSDDLTFPPITNFSITPYNESTQETLHLTVRATGFESLLAAYVVFARVPSNSFKPFLSSWKMETNGIGRLTITEKEFEDSQK
jgi:hypothetical protein